MGTYTSEVVVLMTILEARSWEENVGLRWNQSLFEILVEKFGGKVRRVIMERSRSFLSWICFGDRSLRWLLA